MATRTYSDRTSQRSSNAPYFDRPTPYAFIDRRPSTYDNEEAHADRPVTRGMTQAAEGHAQDQQRERKRIALACSRCRRRKIKCSGDLGDGLGCQACRNAGSDASDCAFMRVRSFETADLPPDHYAKSKYSPGAGSIGSFSVPSTHEPATQSASKNHDNSHQSAYSASLPMLQTRAPFPASYDAPFHDSTFGAYGCPSASMPAARQDSVASGLGLENYRSWPTTSPADGLLPAPYYPGDTQLSSTFGSLHAPAFVPSQPYATDAPVWRAQPPMATDVSHLNASFSNENQTRRLPPITVAASQPSLMAPYTVRYPTMQHLLPQSQRLASYTRSQPVMCTRTEAPSSSHYYQARAGSQCTLDPSSSSMLSSRSAGRRISSTSRTSFGYPLGSTTSNAQAGLHSPDLSPTSGTGVRGSCSSNSSSSVGPGVSHAPFQQVPALSSSGYPLPSVTPTNDYPPSSRGYTPLPGLFSFSTDADEAAMADTTDFDGRTSYEDDYSRTNDDYAATLQPPQSQHHQSLALSHFATSCDSYEQQRASTTQPMSVANLSGPY